MKGLVFGFIRRTLNPRLLVADIHKLVGSATLVFNLLMALTGILLTLGQFLINIYSYVSLSGLPPLDVPAHTKVVSIDTAVATARQAFPEKNVRWVYFPGQLQGKDYYAAIAYEKKHFFARIPHVALINAYDGSLTQIVDLPWYIDMIYIAQPLHFGDFGGLGLRILYAFFGLSAGLLSITGFMMYMIKRKKRTQIPRQNISEKENLPAKEEVLR